MEEKNTVIGGNGIAEEKDIPELSEDNAAEENASAENTGGEGVKRKRRFFRRNSEYLYNITKENDMKYRGPLSYRWLRILGWSCVIISQIVFTLLMRSKILGTDPGIFGNMTVMRPIMALALPFMMMANFAVLLNGHDSYRTLLKLYGGISVAFIGIYMVVYYHYFLGAFDQVFGGISESEAAIVSMLLKSRTFNGYVSFNFFIDLFLFALLLYFVDHTPRKHFRGKRLYIFRSFALIPLIYEVVSIILKILAFYRVITLPVASYAFLPTKPPILFVMFVIMVIFINYRKVGFSKNGRTEADYHRYLRTNTNSWLFARTCAFIMVCFAVVDSIIVEIIYLNLAKDGVDSDMVLAVMNRLGIGQAGPLILMAPIMLLFSYTRKHRSTLVDISIPVGSIVIIVLIHLNNAYELVRGLVMRGVNSQMFEIIWGYIRNMDMF